MHFKFPAQYFKFKVGGRAVRIILKNKTKIAKMSVEKEVFQWLTEDIFLGKDVPKFEQSKATMEELHKLMKMSQEEDLRANTISQIQEAQIEELKDDTAKMKQNLANLGIDINLDHTVEVLAHTAELLNLDDPGEPALDLALGDLRFKASKVPLENHLSKMKHRQDTKRIIEDSSYRSKTEQALNAAQTETRMNEEDIAKVLKKSAFHQEKQREYLELREKCVTIIRKHGFQRHLSHDSIVEMQKSLQAINQELEPLVLKLEAFKGLPPSLELASAKVAEKEKVLLDLNGLLQRKIQNIHL